MVRFDLGPLQGETRIAKFKSGYNSLLVLEVCNVKTTYRKSCARNLLMWSDVTLAPSFKVKQGQTNLKMLIMSGIFSLYVFYYCFYRFAMFGDTPPACNKGSGIINVHVLPHAESNLINLSVLS